MATYILKAKDNIYVLLVRFQMNCHKYLKLIMTDTDCYLQLFIKTTIYFKQN